MAIARSTGQEIDRLGSTPVRAGHLRSNSYALLGPQGIKRWLASSLLVAVHRGVYRLSGVPVTDEQRLLAAVLAAGLGALASHRSAAWLWGILPTHALPIEPEITIPSPRRPRLRGVIVHRSLDLYAERPFDPANDSGDKSAGDDGASRRGRWTRDSRGRARPRAEQAAVHGCRRSEPCTPASADRVATAPVPSGGCSTTERSATPAPTASSSPGWLGCCGITTSRRRCSSTGSLSDGAATASTSPIRTGRSRSRSTAVTATSRPADRQRDYDRQNALIHDGWTVLRFTWDDVTRRPEFVARHIGRELGRRS